MSPVCTATSAAARPGGSVHHTLGMVLVASIIVTTLPGCLVPAKLEPKSTDPVKLFPLANTVRGVNLDTVLTQATETTARRPFDTYIARDLAQAHRTAVVSIFVKTKERYRVRLLPIRLPGPGLHVHLPGKALGSGFFIHKDGYVLTNNHVVGTATEIYAITSDAKQVPLQVVATDPVYDLALLKTPKFPEGSTVLAMGDSSKVASGDFVVAMGNPLGLAHTVTFGIISQTGRHIHGLAAEGRTPAFLQIDAAINPGSSGGPLITTTGAWVGVNTAGAPSAQNIGFSVPSSQAVEFLNNVLEGRGVEER